MHAVKLITKTIIILKTLFKQILEFLLGYNLRCHVFLLHSWSHQYLNICNILLQVLISLNMK